MTINPAFANRTTDGVSSGYEMESDTAAVFIVRLAFLTGDLLDSIIERVQRKWQQQ